MQIIFDLKQIERAQMKQQNFLISLFSFQLLSLLSILPLSKVSMSLQASDKLPLTFF